MKDHKKNQTFPHQPLFTSPERQGRRQKHRRKYRSSSASNDPRRRENEQQKSESFMNQGSRMSVCVGVEKNEESEGRRSSRRCDMRKEGVDFC